VKIDFLFREGTRITPQNTASKNSIKRLPEFCLSRRLTIISIMRLPWRAAEANGP